MVWFRHPSYYLVSDLNNIKTFNFLNNILMHFPSFVAIIIITITTINYYYYFDKRIQYFVLVCFFTTSFSRGLHLNKNFSLIFL